MPRVSVITPVFNDEAFVRETIDGVRRQTFVDWEHVLVDDGSSDGTLAIVEAACREEPRLRLVRQQNAGASVARNNGFAATCTSSTYLLFLDHDDVLEPTMLETLVAYLDSHPDVGVAYCRFLILDADGERHEHTWDTRFRSGLMRLGRIPRDEPETPFETLLMWGGILPSNALIRRSVYDVAGGFDSGYFSDDTDLFMRLGLATRIHYINETLLLYRRHDAQMSADSEATSAALDHLLATKWEPSPMTARERRRFVRGMNLRRYGAQAVVGFGVGLAHAKAGHLQTGARFIGGALHRHALYAAANLGLIRPAWRTVDTPGPTAPSS